MCSSDLMGPFAHVGIAFATAVSAWINVAALAVILKRRGHLTPDAALLKRTPRMILASVIMGAALWALLPLLSGWLAGGLILRATALMVLVAAGLVVFALAALLTGAADRAEVQRLFKRSR